MGHFFVSCHRCKAGILVVLILLGATQAYAAWDGMPYDPGETLDPECAPTDVNCTVARGITVSGGKVGIATTTPYAPLSVAGEVVASHFTGTSTASSTFGGGIIIESGCIFINGQCLVQSDVSGNWAGVFDGQEGSYYLANSFSTTSASYFLSQNQGASFSTTSANYWETLQTARTADDLTNNSITDLSDVDTAGVSAGNILFYDGTTWVDYATTTFVMQNEIDTFSELDTIVVDKALANLDDTQTFANRITFQNGILSQASSTIGSGTQAGGLTINGGATTTGHFTLSGTAANIILGSNYLSGDGGDEGIIVDATGKVGIGTSSPWGTMSVFGHSSNSGPGLVVHSEGGDEVIAHFILDASALGTDMAVSIDNQAASNETYLQLSNLTTGANGWMVGMDDASASFAIDYGAKGEIATPILTILTNENVGIGTVAPITDLHVVGGFFASGSSTIGGGTQAAGLTINGNATTTGSVVIQGTGTSTNAGSLSLVGDLNADQLFVTGATSSFTNGIVLVSGCFFTNGACLFNTDVTGAWTGTFDSFEGTYYLANSFSTTSANYWETLQTARTADDLTNNSITDLSDVDIAGVSAGNILFYDGTTWVDYATTTFVMQNEIDSLSELETLTGVTNLLIENDIDASSELAALMDDETGGAGLLVFNSNPLLLGFVSNASSTIGGGTALTGLTVSGAATTTGNAYIAGNVGVGVSAPLSALHVSATTGQLRLTDSDTSSVNYRHLVMTWDDIVFKLNQATEADPGTLTPFFVVQESTQSFSVGRSAGNAGSGVVSIGYEAGELNTGHDNTFIGYQAGTENTTGTGNLFMGRNTGGANVDGSHNLFLGAYTGNTLTTGSNNIALGSYVTLPSTTGSQQLNIGNVLYGTGMYNTAVVSSSPVAGGKIGIGTTTPWRTLSVAGSSDLGANALAGYFTATSSTASVFPYASSTAISVSGTAYFPGTSIWNSSGNIGIGTTTPQKRLHIVGTDGGVASFPSIGQKDFLIIENSGNSNMNLIGSATGSSEYKFTRSGGSQLQGSIKYDYTNDFMGFYTGAVVSSYKMTILGSGNVGIGRSDPIYLFDVKNSATTPDAPMIAITDPTNNRYAAGIGFNNATRMSFYSGETAGNGTALGSTHERMVITTSGDVGIGTTSPLAKLSVTGSVLAQYFTATSSSIASTIPTASTTNLSVTERLRVDGTGYFDGNLGVGTSAPTYPISVYHNGGANVAGLYISNGDDDNLAEQGARITLQADGAWHLQSNRTDSNFSVRDEDGSHGVYIAQNSGSWISFSDARLKKNIEDYSVLDKLEDYRAVKYDWVVGGNTELGVVAQEIQQIFPELVSKGGAIGGIPDALGISYDRFGPLALQGVKELNEKINTLPEQSLIEDGRITLLGRLLDRIAQWLADSANGITQITAGIFSAEQVRTDVLCVGETCITEQELQDMLAPDADNLSARESNQEPDTPTTEITDDTALLEETDDVEPSDESIVSGDEPVSENTPEEVSIEEGQVNVEEGGQE
jgi:hypothetical protein